MADQNELRQNIDSFTGSSQINALLFLMRSTIGSVVHTAVPVVVTSVTRSGTGNGASYLSCKPLVMQRSASGQSLPNVEIPRVPYFRLQHGSAAFVCDPKVGDVGLAVFAQSDTSLVNGDGKEKAPGSFRTFDMSDGFYFGGFWGQKPTTFVQIEDSGEITITATKSVTVNCKTAEINASTSYTVNAPTINLNGKINGGGSNSQGADFRGDVTADNISLKTHVHGGVEHGGSTTSGPQ